VQRFGSVGCSCCSGLTSTWPRASDTHIGIHKTRLSVRIGFSSIARFGKSLKTGES
jgi:hypothetical protein